MFEAYRQKRAAEKEAKLLAGYQELDADVGNPTPETLATRLRTAALANMWNVVDDCFKKGSSCNDKVYINEARQFRPLSVLVDSQGSSCRVPLLTMAILHGNAAAASKLVAAGCDVNAPIMKGGYDSSTPLYAAVRYGQTGVVRLLCDNGAKLDNTGPLRMAEDKGMRDIIKIIRAEEAKRAQAAPDEDDTQEARGKILDAVDSLPPAGREKLLARLRDKFPAPAAPAAPPPADTGLAQDMQVPKPLNLKKQQPV